jgi:hypothetical protein
MAQRFIPVFRRRYFRFFAVIGLLFISHAEQASGQVIFGDPTSTIGGANRFSLSVGGGAASNEKFKFDPSSHPFITPTQNLSLKAAERSDKFKTESVFLTAAMRLGAFAEVFGTAGQTRIKTLRADGDFGPLWGAGIRISPPQPGPFKAGFVLQGFSAKSKDTSFSVRLIESQPNPDGSNEFVAVQGTGADEISYTGYSGMIGVSAQHFSSFRPYAGVFFTSISGTEKGSISGIGPVNHCPATGGCTPRTESFTSSWSFDFKNEAAIGGLIGFQFNPEGPFTVTAEAQAGNRTAFFVSAGMQF